MWSREALRDFIAAFSLFNCFVSPGGWFSIKVPSYQYRKSHCGDKMILWPFISTMGFPIWGRWYLYIESGPRLWYRNLLKQMLTNDSKIVCLLLPCTTSWMLFDGLVQDCSNSIANALELLQSCTKPSCWYLLDHDASRLQFSQLNISLIQTLKLQIPCHWNCVILLMHLIQ